MSTLEQIPRILVKRGIALIGMRIARSPKGLEKKNRASFCSDIILLSASHSRFSLARLSRGITVLWQRNTPMTAYASLAFDCTEITRRIQSLMSLAISRTIIVRITCYTVVTRRRRLTFTIIYWRIIKFPATAEERNPGTNKAHIEQATAYNHVVYVESYEFLESIPKPGSYKAMHFPELIAIYKINSNARDALQQNKLTEWCIIELKFLS